MKSNHIVIFFLKRLLVIGEKKGFNQSYYYSVTEIRDYEFRNFRNVV